MNPALNNLVCTFAMATISCYSPVCGASEIDLFDPLHIEFKSDTAQPTDMKRQLDEVSTACSNLGDALLVGRGPQGFGVFKTFSCKSDQLDFKVGTPPKRHWRLDVHILSTKVDFQLTPPESTNSLRWELDAKGGGHILAAVGTREVSQIIALRVLDLLPAMVADPRLSENSPLIVGPGVTDLTVPKLRIYSMRLTSGAGTKTGTTLLAHLCGNATYESISNATETAKVESGKWTKDNTFKSKHCIYAHSLDGPGTLAAKIDPVLQRVFSEQLLKANDPDKSLVGTLAENFSGGYLGMRFGISVLNDSALLRKSNMIGILTEFRKGFLSGLRLYIDYAPRVSSGHSNLAWSRVLLGKSWSLDIESLGLKVDVVPKIGRWTFKGDLPVSDTVARFHLNGELSLGVEFGVEYDTPMFVVRTWAGIDRGFSLLGVSGKAVTSKRGGLDAIWKLRQKQILWNTEFSPALMAFAFSEQVSVNNGEEPKYTALGDARLNSIEYIQNYAGGGIAVTW